MILEVGFAMKNNTPANYKLTEYKDHNAKIILNLERKIKILTFIADNSWSTVGNIQALIGVGQRSSAMRLLTNLVDKGKLTVKQIQVNRIIHNIYMITPLGSLLINREHNKHQYRLCAQMFVHNSVVQNIQIISINSGCSWVNELEIIRSKKFRSQPDGLLVLPNDTGLGKMSIEYQRHRISKGRLKEKVRRCLADSLNKHFDLILYICGDNLTAEMMSRLFNSMQSVNGKNGFEIDLTPEYRSRFEFINLSEFAEYLKQKLSA